LLRTCERTGRSLPKFSDDEVVDFQVAEAIVIQVDAQEREEQDKQAREQERKAVGVAGHRDRDFLERARAAE
jgi:hypothetical protein